MFTRVYNRLKYGDKAALANHFGKSLEWISRLTRTGGESCPGCRYVRWYAGLAEVNAAVADRMHGQLCQYIDEIRQERDQQGFSPHRAAAAILTQAAVTVNSLNDGGINQDDVDALTSLKLAVDGALSQISSQHNAKPIRFAGAQPR